MRDLLSRWLEGNSARPLVAGFNRASAPNDVVRNCQKDGYSSRSVCHGKELIREVDVSISEVADGIGEAEIVRDAEVGRPRKRGTLYAQREKILFTVARDDLYITERRSYATVCRCGCAAPSPNPARRGGRLERVFPLRAEIRLKLCPPRCPGVSPRLTTGDDRIPNDCVTRTARRRLLAGDGRI